MSPRRVFWGLFYSFSTISHFTSRHWYDPKKTSTKTLTKLFTSLIRRKRTDNQPIKIKGKTETMLFVNSKEPPSRIKGTLNISVKGVCINNSFSYKNLGIDLHSKWVKLLRSIRPSVDLKYAETIYLLNYNMILPQIFTYCRSRGLGW